MTEMETIINIKKQLDKELKIALSTMEKTSKIKELRKRMKENQINCPHFSNQYNWVIVDEICPYCGKKLGGENNND